MGVNHAVFIFAQEFVGGLLADAFGRDTAFANGACGNAGVFGFDPAEDAGAWAEGVGVGEVYAWFKREVGCEELVRGIGLAFSDAGFFEHGGGNGEDVELLELALGGEVEGAERGWTDGDTDVGTAFGIEAFAEDVEGDIVAVVGKEWEKDVLEVGCRRCPFAVGCAAVDGDGERGVESGDEEGLEHEADGAGGRYGDVEIGVADGLGLKGDFARAFFSAGEGSASKLGNGAEGLKMLFLKAGIAAFGADVQNAAGCSGERSEAYGGA